MDCTTRIEGTFGILTLEGRFGFDAGQTFRAKTQELLTRPGLAELHLDFSAITQMESSALGLLLLLRELAEAREIKVVLLRPSAPVRAALDAVRFDTLFEIRD